VPPSVSRAVDPTAIKTVSQIAPNSNGQNTVQYLISKS
jgi:hypothetical protein